MCWVGKVNYKKIATEDLKCYKIVLRFDGEPHFRPYFRHRNSPMKYEAGKTYCDKICPTKVTEYTNLIAIHEGIHCYDSSVHICRFYRGKYEVSYSLPCGTLLRNGTFLSRVDCEAVLVECTIPKGTLYYMNDRGEIVTEKLIINKTV